MFVTTSIHGVELEMEKMGATILGFMLTTLLIIECVPLKATIDTGSPVIVVYISETASH